MRLIPLLTVFSIPLFITACSPGDAPAAAPETPSVDISQALLGTWETIEMDVDYRSYQGTDTSYTQSISEADWKRLYGVQPARTHFTADGKHKRTHRLVGGQIVDVTNGVWRAQGTDSLLVIEPNRTLYYAYDLNGDRLTLTGTIDYDLDGEEDDGYRSVMRLVSRTQ